MTNIFFSCKIKAQGGGIFTGGENMGDKFKTIRRIMPEYEAMLSIGAVWEEETEDVSLLMAKADDMMYADKRAYYDTQKR